MSIHRGTITVFGSSQVQEGDSRYTEARGIGRLLTKAGFAICCGGYGGLMEAVSRGAREGGGHTIGVTLDIFSLRPANSWIVEEQRNPTYLARVERMIALGDGYLELSGGIGTLSEVAMAWSLLQIHSLPPRPHVLLGKAWANMVEAFRRNLIIREDDYRLLQLAETPEEAVALLEKAIPAEEVRR